MTDSTETTRQIGGYRDKGPVGLVLSGLICIAFAVAIQFLSSVLIRFVVGFHNSVDDGGGASLWSVAARPVLLLHVALIHIVLLALSWRLARSVGHGDRIKGLGLEAISHRGVLFALSISVVPFVAAWVTFLLHLGVTVRASGLAVLMEGDGRGSALIVPLLALIAVGVLAPLSEEVLFRGWLWVGLRRHWGVLPVASLTGFLWLLVHTPEGIERTLFLLPLALVLSTARAICGSTRASVILHMLNNVAFGGYAIFMSL